MGSMSQHDNNCECRHWASKIIVKGGVCGWLWRAWEVPTAQWLKEKKAGYKKGMQNMRGRCRVWSRGSEHMREIQKWYKVGKMCQDVEYKKEMLHERATSEFLLKKHQSIYISMSSAEVLTNHRPWRWQYLGETMCPTPESMDLPLTSPRCVRAMHTE